jgi:hypothetical protein
VSEVLADIAEAIGVVDAAIAMVVELHSDDDFLLAGGMLRLLERRVNLLVAGERQVAGTPHHHLYDAELRVTMDRMLCAQKLFAHLAMQLAEITQPTVH